MTEDEMLSECGGRVLTKGGEKVLWFGMNPSDPEHTAAAVVPFEEDPNVPKVTFDRVVLYKFSQQLNKGKHVPRNWQKTGSCVNGGANNCLSDTVAIKQLRGGGTGEWKIPFTLAAYGESRRMIGMSSPGDGSSGDAMAMALAALGYTTIDAGVNGMPTPTMYDAAYAYTSQVELQFSAARNLPPDVRDACKAHKLTFQKLTSLAECEASIRQCRPFTVAGNWGSTMQMGYKGSGADKVLWGEYASSWEHQQSCDGVWYHPTLGRIWHIMNQWFYVQNGVAMPMHGLPGTDEPWGGYWTSDQMLQHQLNYRNGELRAFVDGTPFDESLLHVLAV